jgi:hypothetical protein
MSVKEDYEEARQKFNGAVREKIDIDIKEFEKRTGYYVRSIDIEAHPRHEIRGMNEDLPLYCYVKTSISE